MGHNRRERRRAFSWFFLIILKVTGLNQSHENPILDSPRAELPPYVPRLRDSFRTATLNGRVKSDDGATIHHEQVTVPAGTFSVCRGTYVTAGIPWDMYDADDIAFNEVKYTAADSNAGAFHTAELRSISKP